MKKSYIIKSPCVDLLEKKAWIIESWNIYAEMIDEKAHLNTFAQLKTNYTLVCNIKRIYWS